MINELIICVLPFLIFIIIDRYSTVFAFIICTCLVYYFVHYFSHIINYRIITRQFTKLWIIISYCFKFSKRTYCFCQRLFSFQKSSLSKSFHPPNYEACGDTLALENEINTLVKNISRYYLCSWYDKIGENDEFVVLLNNYIKDTLLRLCSSISKIEKKKISYIILQLYLHFFSHFVEAKKCSEGFSWENFKMTHWAIKDSSTEWCYLQSLVSALLNKFGPSDTENSFHSKYSPLLHTIVVEILTETLIQPLVRVLCDPSRINSLILKVLLNESKADQILSKVENTPEVQPMIVLPPEEELINSVFNSLPENVNQFSQNRLSVSATCCTNQMESDSFVIPSKNTTTLVPIDFSSLFSPAVKSSSSCFLNNSEFSDSTEQKDEGYQSASCDTSIIKRSKSADFIRQLPLLKALNEKDYDIKLQKGNNKIIVSLKSETNSNSSIEQAEEAVEVEVPTLFTDVKITDTVQQNEEGILPYTLYCIQYLGLFHDTGDSSDAPRFVTHVVSIKRRFSEFVALQSRLEDNPILKNYLKGIKGPSKWLTLPFSNLDKKYIAERKIFLEGYLKELCTLAPIAQSGELQEFLAYGGDARISFVKRAGGDINVPRLDKFLVRGVKGAIDIFKTALPNSSLEIEGLLPMKSSLEDTSPDQRFQEHLLDFSSREPEIREHIKNYFQNSMENPSYDYASHKSKSFDSKIKKTSSLLRNLHNFKTVECCMCSGMHDNFIHEENPFGITIIELIDVAMNLNSMNIGDKSFDLRTKLVTLLAPLINRYITNKIDNISENHLANSLHALHKYLWPDVTNEDNSFTMEENISNVDKIVECLEVLLSSNQFVHNNIYRIEKSILKKMKIKLFLLSLQNEKMNKCLLFHMFDVLIEFVCSK